MSRLQRAFGWAGIISGLAAALSPAAEPVSLAGPWRFALDRADAGIREQWFQRALADRIELPGVLQSQGFGDQISVNTPWVLSLYDKLWFLREDYRAYTNAGAVKVPFVCQPPRHYLGAAWYQRDIEIPGDWKDRRVVLFLERPHWESRVWLDDKLIGTNNSLCAPHEYELGVALAPGPHRLTVRVDNRMLMPYRPDAHSVSDSLGSSWNGIAGKLEVRSTPRVWIEDVQVFPNAARKSVTLRTRIGNAGGPSGSGRWIVSSRTGQTNWSLDWMASWERTGGAAEMEVPLGSEVGLWDEFNPNLQRLELRLEGSGVADRREIGFGLRDFKADGQKFLINGRETYLRGTHHGGDFPLTGYPPTDVEYWRKLFRTCKEWGLNHVRFHSFCPPEAAFEAADEVGIYLQPEPGMWNEVSPNTPMERMLYAETERMLKAYGNHPSFVLFSAGNEPRGRWQESLTAWCRHFRTNDPRHLYTPGTGWPLIDRPGPVTGDVDYLAIMRFDPPNRLRGEGGWFGRDYSRSLRGVNVPVISHETGQWCAYPDYDVIKKFTGYMRPGNYEIFRDSAEAHGLFTAKEAREATDAPPSPLGGERAGVRGESKAGRSNEVSSSTATSHPSPSVPLPSEGRGKPDIAQRTARPANKDFAWASGRFQLACYKEEIEANLRTPGLSGFQLLDLHDYVGQGTALVGLLDPLWETKGYVTPKEFTQFCSPVVPLARLTRRVFTTSDSFEVEVEVANYEAAPITNAVAWWMIGQPGTSNFLSGGWQVNSVPVGKSFQLGKVSTNLQSLNRPGAYRLTTLVEYEPRSRSTERWTLFKGINEWTFWLYPSQVSTSVPSDILIASSWDEAQTKLAAGGKVLFLPRNADLSWDSPPLADLPVFWNRLMNPGWARMLGLWCDTNHPALAEFPTEPNCDWQWTQILRGVRAVNLDRLPRDLQPIVQAIDDWNRNWKLGAIFECRVGPGRLMVCAFDIERDLENRVVARQLRRSLLDYMASERFQPQTEVSAAQFETVLFDNRIMRKLSATASGEGSGPNGANAAIDGDPNTAWLAGGTGRGQSGTRHPHALTVSFPAPTAMNGIVLMPRQNDRDHFGDVRGYRIESSDDGEQWREVGRGELASTWAPHTLKFAQTVTAKQLRFTALTGFGNDRSAALAELAVLCAGPKLSATETGPVEFRRSRSTSTDVDEGTDAPAVRTNTLPRRP